MSIDHVKAALDSPNDIEGGQFKVLMALAEWANSDGICWYSVAEIARRAHRSYRGTIYILQQLEADGYISVEHSRGRGNSSRYTVMIEALATPRAAKENVQSASKNVQSSTGKSAKAVAHITTENVQSQNGKYAEVVAPFSDVENVQSGVQNVQSSRQNVQFGAIKCATQIAHEPLVNHQENHQENHQDSGDVAPEVAPDKRQHGRGKGERKPRQKKEPKYQWPEDFKLAYLWRRLGEEFGPLTWSGADYARETGAVSVVVNAGIEEGVTEEDIVAFLRYVAACDRRWKANGAEMPLLSRNHTQFGSWWAAGKPEQPQDNVKGGYSNGNGTGNGADGYGADRNGRTNRSLDWNARFAARVRASSGDSQELPRRGASTP